MSQPIKADFGLIVGKEVGGWFHSFVGCFRRALRFWPVVPQNKLQKCWQAKIEAAINSIIEKCSPQPI